MSWTEMARNGRILVVDDAMENIQLLHQALQDEHDVLFALEGERALALARQQRPDLILLDAIMPGMDGYAVCAALRADPATADIPIIFITALNSPEDETRALEAGAADFISKPVNTAVMRARVRTHLTVKRQSDALRELTLTDGLTGVANRRAFDERLHHEWRRSARSRTPLSLIMLDIDHFKAYNDGYGHQQGDDCLRRVSSALTRAAGRPQDMAARYGGEEFAVLLPQVDQEGAEAVARKLIDEVRTLDMPHSASSQGRVTISLGVATIVPDSAHDPAHLVKLADALLYQSKLQGRNRYNAQEE
jgi:diguanylate cyclase (GGDEF)-like protein